MFADSCDMEDPTETISRATTATANVCPGAVAVQGNGSLGCPTDGMLDDIELGENLHDNALPSLIVAAQVVDHQEGGTPNFGPGSTLWERQVQEEVQTRLFLHKQNLAVAEAFTVDTRLTSDTGTIGDGTQSEKVEDAIKNRRLGLWRVVCCSFLGLGMAVAVFVGVKFGTRKRGEYNGSMQDIARLQC
jgi:hypothetical protein